jgi:hypothetical protein
MRLLVRLVAIFTALALIQTVWFMATFAMRGGLRPLLATGLLGGLTILGWLIVLVAGPVAAVQLWRFRESGRRAGIILFGYSVAYYAVGLVWLRSPGASGWRLFIAAGFFALPLVVLLSRRTRALCSEAKQAAAA